MVNIEKIQFSLLGLVGFKQPYNPDYAILDVNNQISESGYFITDNSFAKIEFIKDTQDYIDISDNDFNNSLRDIKKTAISNVVNQVFNQYDFIDRSLMFKNASNKINTENLPLGFVGYKIQVSSLKNIAFKISRVLLDFSGTGDVELIMWNTAKKEPIFSKVLTITSDHQQEELNWVLDNSNDSYKGDYYIGYINDGSLTVTPFKREYNNANVMTTPTYLSLESVKVVNHSGTTLFNLDNVDGLSEDSGLNFDFSVYEDFTDFVINNKMLFARAVQMSAVINCIQLYISSLRSSRNEKQASEIYQKIMIELEGTDNESAIKVIGLKKQLLSEITSIKSEIEKMRKGFTKSNCIMVSTLM
jgi:hypothetical protein